MRIFCCPKCGNIVVGYGMEAPRCCGVELDYLSPIIAGADKQPQVEEMDGAYCLTWRHPMTKDNYIAAVVLAFYNRIELIRMFPEQEAIVHVSQLKGVDLYWVVRSQREVTLYKVKV
ncbi:MAG: hypothetical protein KBT04_07710 [Bacteroidales bacterium]|nr:hypothetical protein [Candidatus Colimorpha onthohippi]